MQHDAELVEAVLAGRQEAFAELVRRYERAVRAEVLTVVRDYHAAQDIAQDAFVAAYERLASLRRRAAFGGWLLQIARRRALDDLRRKRLDRAVESPPSSPAPAGNGQLNDAARQLLDAIGRLPEHERTAVVLHYFEGKKVREIADITRRPVSTITVQLGRARARLRKSLEESES